VALLGGVDEDAVRSELRDLVKIELVRQATLSTVEDQEEFAFWHTLVRDVAYEQIPRAARAEKHRAAARWLESMAEERVGDVAEILAHHVLSALELLRSVPDADRLEELETAGAGYLRLAATRTMALDVSKAEGQLRQALDLIPEEHPDRPRIQAALGEAVFVAGRLEEADGAYAEAIAGLQAQGAVGEAADAMVRRSVVLEYRGEVAAARSILSEAVESLDPSSSGAELARALATSAGGLMISGRFREAVEKADRAIELAESAGELHASARAHGFRGYSRVVALGDLGGLSEQRKALEMLLSLGAGRTAAIVYHNLVGCLVIAEGPRSALDLLSEAEEFAEGRGLREMVLALRNQRVTTLFQTGDWDELLQVAEEVASEARRQGSGYDEAFVEADRAFVLACRRDPAALERCGAALAMARAVHEPPILLRALGAAALARSAGGDRAGALALVEEALVVTEGEGAIVRLTELPHLVRLAIGEGDHPLAERLMEGTEPGRLEWYRLSRTSARAVVDEARGDREGALRGYEEAWKGWTEWGHALERAHALAGAGRCLAETGGHDEAVGRFGASVEAFEELGMKSELSELQGRLDALGDLRP
jgi:tetratricopeptide (TPR) repeat protein